MDYDLTQALILIVLVVLAGLTYGVRSLFFGRVNYERVNLQQSSFLMSKDLMQGFYWFMQPLARLAVFFRISPNLLSWGSLGFGLLAGVCLAVGHFGFGAAFASLSAILDSLDGLVARLTSVASDAGEVLDATIDRYVEFFFLGGLVFYYREIPVGLALSLLALCGSFMVSYSTAKAEALKTDPPKAKMRRPERAFYLILGAALSPITIPWLESIREYPVAMGHPMIISLGLVGVLSNLSAIERMFVISQIMRKREAIIRSDFQKSSQEILLNENQEKNSARIYSSYT